MKQFYYLLISIFLYTSCQNVDIPKEKYYQFYSNSKVIIKNDSILCSLNNPLDCPLRFYISTSDVNLNKSLQALNPVVVSCKKDTLIKIKINCKSNNIIPSWKTVLGDPNNKIVYNKVSLPFCKGRSYKVIQGYDGWFFHNTDYLRYSIDFGLKLNDTICAAGDGFVVGVVKDYKVGGSDKRLEPYANFITIYHPQTGLFTQYVHLKYNGSLVKVGDIVMQGQAIGLVGLTGRTTIEHLHFNVLIPIENEDGLKSMPINFLENYRGIDLSNDIVVKK
jgi:murein DD-endopeptidase MepM/ murein hydrolase activator NlpD